MAYSGGCSCGAVRYEASGEPLIQGNCHCRHCQKSTGSAYSAMLFFPIPAVKLEGEARSFDGAGESGTTTLVFCPKCGTQLLTRPVTMAGMVGVRAGDIFVRSAASWDYMNPALPKFETFPPMA